nr:hypothetical protein BCACJCBH_00060 [White spot syndrome virus]
MSSSEGGPLGRPNVRLLQKWLVQKRTLTLVSFWNRRFWRGWAPRTGIASSDLPFREEILLILHLKIFLKIFLGHSSLEGGPLGRPDVKFRGWTAGSTQCQITPEMACPEISKHISGTDVSGTCVRCKNNTNILVHFIVLFHLSTLHLQEIHICQHQSSSIPFFLLLPKARHFSCHVLPLFQYHSRQPLVFFRGR